MPSLTTGDRRAGGLPQESRERARRKTTVLRGMRPPS